MPHQLVKAPTQRNLPPSLEDIGKRLPRCRRKKRQLARASLGCCIHVWGGGNSEGGEVKKGLHSRKPKMRGVGAKKRGEKKKNRGGQVKES